jgi:hypothetical protein
MNNKERRGFRAAAGGGCILGKMQKHDEREEDQRVKVVGDDD